MQILNATSIEMTIQHAQPQELIATCYLNNTFGVDMTRVYVGKFDKFEKKIVIICPIHS